MQLFLIFLKNKVAYVSYPNLKNYFVSRVWCKFHRIPVNHQEKICGEWVQTRGYQACVVYMPIPLRVCLAKAPTLRKALLQNYGKPKTPQQPFDILKQETIIGNSMLLVLPIIFSPDTGGACDERNQTTVFDW